MNHMMRIRWLTAASILGIGGDLLLRPDPLGLNLFLWTAMAVGTLVVLRSPSPARWRSPGALWWLAAALAVLAGTVWRASPLLVLMDLLVTMVLLAVAVSRLADSGAALPAGGRLLLPAVGHGLRVVLSLGPALFGRGGAASSPGQDPAGGEGTRAAIWGIGVGVILAIPLLIVFGLLFSGADPAFGRFLSDVLDVPWDEVVRHLFLSWWWAAAAGVFLLAGLVPTRREGSGWRPRLGPVTVSTVLGLVQALFLLFVAFQFRVLFGGEAVVRLTEGLTYAEYARQGFFQLVVASALVLPMLYSAGGLLDLRSVRVRRLFAALVVIQLVLLAVVMASAGRRMALYVEHYGLTPDRLYATAFMGWLAVTVAWYAWAVIRNRLPLFEVGALAAGCLMLFGLHAVNPEGAVVRWNVARAEAGREFDVAHALALSDDAVPALVGSLSVLGWVERCQVARGLQQRRAGQRRDWRTGTVARLRARASLARLDRPPECTEEQQDAPAKGVIED